MEKIGALCLYFMWMAVYGQSSGLLSPAGYAGFGRNFPGRPELPRDGRIYYEYHGETIWHFVPFSGWCTDTARVVNRETLAYENPYAKHCHYGGTPLAEQYPERLYYRVENGLLKTGFQNDGSGSSYGKQPLSSVYYQNGLLQGDACFYYGADPHDPGTYSSGGLKAAGRFEKGYRWGKWLFYDGKGNIQECRDYGNGRAWPLRTVYYKKWGYTTDVTFLTGHIPRESRTCNASGELVSAELLTDHALNENGQDRWLYEVKSFYPGGQLRCSRMEWRGDWGVKRTGTEAYYDENGLLTRSFVHE